MANKTYIVENANNPIESDFYKDIIQKDANGNPLVDSQNRIRVKRYVVHGSVGLNEASVDAKINTAKSEINSTIADLHHVTTDTTQTVSGNKTFTGETRVPTVDSSDSSTKAASTAFVQGKVTALQNTLNTFLDSDDATLDQASELVAAIKANKTDIASLVADKATKVELAEIAEKSNAITVSNTAPNVASMPVASGIMHPAQNIITENPDVSILALQQNLWAYNATRDYAVGSFVIYNNSIYQCLVANGPSSTVANPSNVLYWTQIPTLEDLKNKFVPTGTILLYAGSVLPDSYLGCQGAPFDPVTYADLYAKIGTTYGGTAQSPLLPDFRDRYPIGAGTNAVGTYISEQLPNITGNIGSIVSDGNFCNLDGCFSDSGDNYNIYTPSGNIFATKGHTKVSFNAHNSNSVYTDSGKVYPQSIALNFIIKT